MVDLAWRQMSRRAFEWDNAEDAIVRRGQDSDDGSSTESWRRLTLRVLIGNTADWGLHARGGGDQFRAVAR